MSNQHDHSKHNHNEHGHHGHSHGPANYNKAFAIGIVLNFGFVLTEAGYGYVANSLALMADAGHNLSDVLGLILAWAAAWLSTRKPSNRHTYGLRSFSILAALANALLLLVAVAGIAWEAIARFKNPAPISGNIVIIVAGIGILINSATALLFMSGRKGDLNIRGAYLHMAADALVSLGVVIAGIVIAYTSWNWLDPAISLLISAVIVFSTWQLLRDSLHLAIQGVPSGIDIAKIRAYLSGRSGVSAIHDLHIWPISTTETALTAHLVIPSGHPGDNFLWNIAEEMKADFSIHHSTIQIEVGDSKKRCELEPDEIV
jgi:cobalt-zinc-cadmium efflux system protein